QTCALPISGLLFLTCGMFVPFVLVHHVLEHLLIGARQYDLRQEARDLGVHFTLANTDARTGLSMASVVDVLIALEFSSQQSSAGTSQVAAIFKLMTSPTRRLAAIDDGLHTIE